MIEIETPMQFWSVRFDKPRHPSRSFANVPAVTEEQAVLLAKSWLRMEGETGYSFKKAWRTA